VSTPYGVGLVGLGAMGRAVAARLADEGVRVVATSRTPSTRAAAGAELSTIELRDTPAEVAAALTGPVPGAPVTVLTSLPAGAQVAEAVFAVAGLLAGLSPGQRLLLVDLSTTDPADAVRLRQDLHAAGHTAVDAPVSGGPTGARAGSLSIMVGAGPDDLLTAEPVLARLGTVVHCGGPGAGQIAKACNQLLVASTLVAVAEALTLARRSGVDPAVVRTALLGGYAQSRVLQLQGESMLRRDFAGRGSAALLAKDVRIVRRLARAATLGTPVLDAAGEVVQRLAAQAPQLDHSAVVTIIEEGPA
jgi:2-hydroxy-3-oxopropionate reductase